MVNHQPISKYWEESESEWESLFEEYKAIYEEIDKICPTKEEYDRNLERRISGNSYIPEVLAAYNQFVDSSIAPYKNITSMQGEFLSMNEMMGIRKNQFLESASLEDFKKMCEEKGGYWEVYNYIKFTESSVNKFKADFISKTQMNELQSEFGISNWNEITSLYKDINEQLESIINPQNTDQTHTTFVKGDRLGDISDIMGEIKNINNMMGYTDEEHKIPNTEKLKAAVIKNYVNEKHELKDFVAKLKEYERIIQDSVISIDPDKDICIVGKVPENEEEKESLLKKLANKLKENGKSEH